MYDTIVDAAAEVRRAIREAGYKVGGQDYILNRVEGGEVLFYCAEVLQKGREFRVAPSSAIRKISRGLRRKLGGSYSVPTASEITPGLRRIRVSVAGGVENHVEALRARKGKPILELWR